MAPGLRRWIVAGLVACATIGWVYLPPRGVRPGPRVRERTTQPTGARERERGLAHTWQAADLELRLTHYRQRLAPELAQRRQADEPGLALLVDSPDSIPESSRRMLRDALDTVWRR